MDFSKMSTPEVARIASRVCVALNESSGFTDAYYRIHDSNYPVIYATVVQHGLPLAGSGVRVTIRSEQIAQLAHALDMGRE